MLLRSLKGIRSIITTTRLRSIKPITTIKKRTLLTPPGAFTQGQMIKSLGERLSKEKEQIRETTAYSFQLHKNAMQNAVDYASRWQLIANLKEFYLVATDNNLQDFCHKARELSGILHEECQAEIEKALANTSDYGKRYELMLNLKALKESYLTASSHPDSTKRFFELDKMLGKLTRELESRREDGILHWLNVYAHEAPQSLLRHFQTLDANKTVNAFARLDQECSKHALRLLLHPACPVMMVGNRGLYAKDAITVAKANHQYTILVCPEEDKDSPAALLADRVITIKNINDPEEYRQAIQLAKKELPRVFRLTNESYINGLRLADVPLKARPAFNIAFDPGYGGISENPQAPRMCAEEGVIFIGPSATAMRALGDKAYAKKTAERIGIPVIPGYHGEDQALAAFEDAAERLRYGRSEAGLMLKGVGGGGGTSNRLVKDPMELKKAHAELKDEKLLELSLLDPSHREKQVFRKGKTTVVVPGERECSLQKRYQKLMHVAIAESEAKLLYSDYDQATEDARKLAEGVESYSSALTVEYLYKMKLRYFLEGNTRLQVEHGPTESLMEDVVDLLQLRHYLHGSRVINIQGRPVYLQGEPSLESYLIAHLQAVGIFEVRSMSAQQMLNKLSSMSSCKYCVEVRINAVEPKIHAGQVIDVPVAGIIEELSLPTPDRSKGIIDCGVALGTNVDSFKVNPTIMLVRGKGKTFKEACENTLAILKEIKINLPTNIEYQTILLETVKDKSVRSLHTGMVAQEIDPAFKKHLEQRQQVQSRRRV